jgi:metacaspase-1
MEPLRVLCVHGVGDHHSDTTWQADWTRAITQSVARFDTSRVVLVDFLMYDEIFERYPLGAATIASAIFKLSASGIIHGIGDLFRRGRGFADIPARVRWTAGMVVQWGDKPQLRAECAAR